jgi:hypothetical protein
LYFEQCYIGIKAMEWLNLKTSVLHAPEYIGSKPHARATWLSVSLWSAQQENRGRIEGARTWKDRQWQQTCGVTLREIDAAALLLTWQDQALVVWNYPASKEEVVRTNRETAILGGLASARARRAKAAAVQPNGSTPVQPTGATEWKGIGKEGEEEAARARGGLPDSLNTPQFSERWTYWKSYWAKMFNHGNDMDEMIAHQQLRDLAAMGEQRAIAAINNSIAKGNLRRPAEPFTNGESFRPAAPIRLGQNLTEASA